MSAAAQMSRALAFEAWIPRVQSPWLRGSPWCWCIRSESGDCLADGEGCGSAGAAIEKARTVAREDFAWEPTP